MTQTVRHARLVLASVGFLAVVVFTATLERVPTPSPDFDFYASIARSVQLHDSGVPSVMRHSPAAVDHVDFYGPVFFHLAALSFRLFGISILSFKIVSALGSLLIAAAGAWLARLLSQTSDRWLWALVLLLLSPELSATITAGTMHTLAVGLELMALAVFVQGLATRRAVALHGAAAGLLLTLAALTTPRTYPFIVAFLASGLILPSMPREGRRVARRQWAVALVVLLTGLCVWATLSHDSPLRWARYMWFVLGHEDDEIALLPTATRIWSWNWSAPLTVTVAVAGMAVAAVAMSRRARGGAPEHAGLVAFALLTAWITSVSSVLVMNLTNAFRLYWVIPLFAVVLAVPYRQFAVPRRLIALGVAGLLVFDAAVVFARYARVAVMWPALDPAPIEAFFRTHVAAGSVVIGPAGPYFMPVERSGAHYRFMEAESWAHWARWVPILDRDAVVAAHETPATRPRARFLVWSSGDLPDEYACARAHLVAVYEPPARHLDWLAPAELSPAFAGYPKSRLYRLPAGCPTGYDPSAGSSGAR